MNNQIKYMLNYQEVGGKLKEIEESIKKTDEAKKYAVAGRFLKTVGESLSTIDAKAKPLIDSYNALLNDVKQLEQKAEEFSKSVETCENDDELNYLKKKFQDVANSILAKEESIKNLQKNIDDIFSEYNKLRKEKLLSESVIQGLRENRYITLPNISTICSLLECQPGDLLEYVSDPE